MVTTTQQDDGVKGYECKHALYFTATDGSMNDVVVVKEYKHYKDGRREPNLRQFVNYRRPFWVTRPMHRNHKDKKEWERIERLQKFECTQIELPKRVCQALGLAYTGNPPQDLRRAFASPYIYGCDADPPLLIKRRYMDASPDCISDNLVAVLDIETDIVEGHEEPILISITMKSRVKLIVVRSFMDGIVSPEEQIRTAMEKYLGDPESEIGDLIRSRNLQLEIEWAKNAGEAAYKAVQTAHAWQPDILAIWNMNFDIPRLNHVLVKYGYDLAETWSDPRIYPAFRYFNYREGKAVKKTASGKQIALAPAEQWHVLECPASFYVLDAMCVYLRLRIAKGKEASYSLDYILKKHGVGGKLKIPVASHLRGGAWHRHMQQFEKVFYCIYNIYDCISMELLDEKTTDLCRVASLMCGHSPWERFPSQPKRTVDDLYFLCLERGLVTATCSRQMMEELDELVVGLEDWIVTLPSYLVADDGICALEELPSVRTNYRAHVADLDVEGTYPNEEVLMNISKETTAQELAKIQGVSDQTRRAIGINLSGGHVNAVEIVVKGYGAPTMDQLLAAYVEDTGAVTPVTDILQVQKQPRIGGVDLLGEGFVEEELAVESDEDDEEDST